jgi:hypothetical protein
MATPKIPDILSPAQLKDLKAIAEGKRPEIHRGRLRWLVSHQYLSLGSRVVTDRTRGKVIRHATLTQKAIDLVGGSSDSITVAPAGLLIFGDH